MVTFHKLLLTIFIVTPLFMVSGCGSSNGHEHTFSDDWMYNNGHEHTFSDDWMYNKEKHWHASTCGHDVRKDEDEHIFKEIITEPTFDSEGYTTHVCSICSYSFTDGKTGKLPHNYSSDWSFNSYSHWHACIDDGYETILKQDNKPHVFYEEVVEPTGSSGGYTEHICSICGYSYKDNETEPLTYTITWKNYDGTILEKDTNVPYLELPHYDGETPIKEGNSQYTYSFSGWSPNIEAVTEDVVYTAQFESSVNEYTITWKNYDGTVLSTDIYQYGATPFYTGEEPSREKDAQYTYSFSGWSPNIEAVTEDVVYTAQFESSVNEYTITWKNYDGTVLSTDVYQYGSVPSYSGTISNQIIDEQYYNRFVGWDPDIQPVTSDTVYTAQFERCVRQYQVVFDAGEGYFDNDHLTHKKTLWVYYGELPSFDDVPTGFSREYANVSFTGWDKEVSVVTESQHYYATYSFSNRNKACLEYEFDKDNRTVGFYTPYDYEGSGSGSGYQWSVDWGDGTTVDKKNKTHTYSLACGGTYFIRYFSSSASDITFDSSSLSSCTGRKFIKNIDIYYDYGSNGGAFGACTSLENLRFHSFVNVSNSRFSGKNISFKSSSGNIRQCGFQCSRLESVDFGNSTINTIGDSAFATDENLSYIKLPSTVTKLDTSAFAGCKSLSISISSDSSLTTISTNCFLNCPFYSFTLPNKISRIDNSAFARCANLSSVSYQGTKSRFMNVYIGSNVFSGTKVTKIHCTDGDLSI